MDAKSIVTLIVVAFAMSSLACGSAPSSSAPSTGSEPVSGTTQEDLDVVHQTVVRTNADGTLSVTHVDVAVAQVEAMLAERMRTASHVGTAANGGPLNTGVGEPIGMVSSAISSPTGNGAYPATGCGNNDLWLFSSNNDCVTIPRGTYQLCYNAGTNTGTGTYLSTVTYPGPPTGNTWYQHVVTYAPGSQSGAVGFDVPNTDGCWHEWGQNDYFSCHHAGDTYNSNPDCSAYVGTFEAYL